MADLYSTLGVARGADEAEIKKAYRKLAKELHPDRNKDNPKASERFSKVTQAYDILTDKDKRAQYDRGEIDEDGNPRAPFGYGAGPQPGAGGGFRRGPNGSEFEFGGEAADLSDLFEGLFSGGGAPRSGPSCGSPVGRVASGEGAVSVAEVGGFPAKLFVTIVGVTYLFSVARRNGTIDWLVAAGVRLVGGKVALIPGVLFLVAALLTAFGTFTPAAVAIRLRPARVGRDSAPSGTACSGASSSSGTGSAMCVPSMYVPAAFLSRIGFPPVR